MRPAFDSVVVRRTTPNLQMRPGNQHVAIVPAQSFDDAFFPASAQVKSIVSHSEKAVVFSERKRPDSVAWRLGFRIFYDFSRNRDLLPANFVTGVAPRGGGCSVEPEIQEYFLAGFSLPGFFLAGLHRKGRQLETN